MALRSDLNYPAKNQFRQNLLDLSRESTELGDRPKVLTLETPDLYEVERVWRPLGAREEDITIVEKDALRAKMIQDEFAARGAMADSRTKQTLMNQQAQQRA